MSPTGRTTFRWMRRWQLLLVAVGLATILGGYAYFLGPVWIEVTHHHVRAPGNPPLKIAHLSDLHTRGLGRMEQRLLALLEEEKPDVIVITGDGVSADGTGSEVDKLYEKLAAPLGVYLVNGNWEHWRHVPQTGARNIRQLNNANARIGHDLYLVGLDDSLAGRPDLESALGNVRPGAFLIALFHSPAFFPEVSGRVHLALAGHTHGGQVRLPWIGPLWLPPGSGDFVHGWYERGSSRLYVSRGLGNSVLPIRFLCRPELAILTVGQ